jgi:ribosomal protein S6--L-glutamate ligase
VRIVFINKAERPASSGSIYPDVIADLEARGATVENVVPETRLFDLSALDTSADLYVLRTRTVVGLNLAAALDVAGARMLIPFARERVLRNKFLLQQKLVAAAIPVPRSYLVWSRELLYPLVENEGPLIVKPHEGHGGQGVQVVSTRAELDALGEIQGPIFAQEFVRGGGSDVKVYGVGAHVSAIRRVFPARSPEEKRGTPLEPTPEIAAIASRCDEVLGLRLYGVDLIETARGPLVIDINSMPGYKGIDGAAARVAELIYQRATAVPAAGEIV